MAVCSSRFRSRRAAFSSSVILRSFFCFGRVDDGCALPFCVIDCCCCCFGTVCVPSRSILLFISAMHCRTMKSFNALVRSVSGTSRALERTFDASTEVAFSVYSEQEASDDLKRSHHLAHPFADTRPSLDSVSPVSRAKLDSRRCDIRVVKFCSLCLEMI